MISTYRLDIRYQPESGVMALERINSLVDAIEHAGFKTVGVSSFDDGMRVSIFLEGSGAVQLKLLKISSDHGTVGRFSCRKVEATEADKQEELIHA
jgi:hypothetical protein